MKSKSEISVQPPGSDNAFKFSSLELIEKVSNGVVFFLFSQRVHEEAISEIDSRRQAIRENITETETVIENCESELKFLNEKMNKLQHKHQAKKSSLRTQLTEAKL